MANKTSEGKAKPKKYRKMVAVLYDEDPTHLAALDKIRSSYQFAMIKHDCDVIEGTGELKKAHWHIVLDFRHARYLTGVSKALGITDNYLKPCSDDEQYLRYLIHADDPDKYQYPLSAVEATPDMLTRLDIALSRQGVKPTEVESVSRILSYLDSLDDVVTIRELIAWSIGNECYSALRRGGWLMKVLVQEHNDNVEK